MNQSIWRLGGGLLLATVLSVVCVGGLHAQDNKNAVVQELGGTLGVVDYNNLLKAHPDYERLAQYDEQLAELKAEIETLPMIERTSAIRSMQERFKAEYEKAEAEMEAEQAAITAEMRGMESALKNKLQAMADEGQSRMKAKLDDYVKKHAPEMAAQNQPAAPIMPSQNDAQKNLLLLRERKNQAIKLEVEKAHREAVEAERARIDSEIAAYEDEVMRAHQQEKLNLQLKVQVAKDEAEQAELQAQLEAISDEEERLKDAKRAELEGQYKSFRAESEATQAAEIKSKQAAVDREVRAQLGALPSSSGPAPEPARPRQPQLTPELKALIAKEEARLRAEMEAASAEAKTRMEAEQANAVARLKAKQEQLKARMTKLQEEMKRVLAAADSDSVSPATKAKLDIKQAQFDKLEAQRKELYDKMVADLKGDIGDVAREKGIDIVIGAYVENRTCTDLTDYAMVAIKTKARPDEP